MQSPFMSLDIEFVRTDDLRRPAAVLLLAEGTWNIGLGFHARIASVKMQEKTWYIDHVVKISHVWQQCDSGRVLGSDIQTWANTWPCYSLKNVWEKLAASLSLVHCQRLLSARQAFNLVQSRSHKCVIVIGDVGPLPAVHITTAESCPPRNFQEFFIANKVILYESQPRVSLKGAWPSPGPIQVYCDGSNHLRIICTFWVKIRYLTLYSVHVAMLKRCQPVTFFTRRVNCHH